MFRLALILHIFIGSTLAGSAVIAALVMGDSTLWTILIAALAGVVAAVPVSAIIARKLYVG